VAVVALLLDRKEPRVDHLSRESVDLLNQRAPRAHVELAELAASGFDRRARRDGLRVDDEAARFERCVDSVQGVHDVLGRDTSERPAAEREIEPPTWDVEGLGVVGGEPNAVAQLARERRPGLGHSVGVGVKRVDVRPLRGRERRQPSAPQPTLEDSLPGEVDHRGDRRWLGAAGIATLHQ
jgi:hypothetical protein